MTETSMSHTHKGRGVGAAAAPVALPSLLWGLGGLLGVREPPGPANLLPTTHFPGASVAVRHAHLPHCAWVPWRPWQLPSDLSPRGLRGLLARLLLSFLPLGAWGSMGRAPTASQVKSTFYQGRRLCSMCPWAPPVAGCSRVGGHSSGNSVRREHKVVEGGSRSCP